MKSNMVKKVYNWLDERYDLTPLIEFARHKKVPVHEHTIWYYMGGVTLFLFLIQIFTGILLSMYYQPGPDSSYESLRFLLTKVRFGWLIRSIHSWSANLMIFFAFVHMFSTFFTRAYKKPRELTWVTGFILLSLSMAFGFSGYLLPWNELAFFATKVGTEIVGAVPVVGPIIMKVLRGGSDVTGATIYRFYAIHITLLPALFMLVLALHLVFVQKHGMSEPEHLANLPESRKKYIPFFPNFLLRDLILWLIVFDILVFLAVYYPWELGLKADPFAPAPAGIRPEWYFMFMFQTLKLLPGHILFIEGEVLGILIFMVGGLLWMLVPFWALKGRPDQRIQPMEFIGVVVLIYIGVMTILGYAL